VPPAPRVAPKLSIPEKVQVRKPAAEAPAVQSPAPAAQADAPPDGGPLDIERILRAWPLILDKVKRRKISSHAMLLPATPVGWRDGELVLEFEPRSRFHRDKMSEQTQHGPLLDAFHEVLGVRPKLSCVLGSEAPPVSQAAGSDGMVPNQEDLVEEGSGEEPPDAIEMIRRAFNASVVTEESSGGGGRG
jgi:hypothetical protein